MDDSRTPPNMSLRPTDPMGLNPGRFATTVNIGHTPEFFALDFRAITPENEACLLGRFFITPQHAKRLVHALLENISGFEQQYGPIDLQPTVTQEEEHQRN